MDSKKGVNQMKNGKDNLYKIPLLILVYTICMMLVVSFLPEDLEIAGIQLKHVDVIADLKADPEDSTNDGSETIDQEIDTDDGFIDPDYIEPDTSADDEFIDPDYIEPDSSDEDDGFIDPDYIDDGNLDEKPRYNSAGISLLNNLVDATGDFFAISNSGKDKLTSRAPVKLNPQPITGNVKSLKPFFDALKRSKNQKVRIAHYGDSAIEGDLVTADIRQNLQTKYGGKGVGFLSITSQDIQFRRSTKHSFSKDWTTAALYSSNPKRLPLGIAGTVAIPNKNSWVEYKTTRLYRTVKTFNVARLFYSDAKNSSINYKIEGKKGTSKLRTGKKVNEVKIDAGKSVSNIRIEFPQKDQGYFYGVSLEGGNGIYVDNLPLRGNSGVDLQQIDLSLFKDFQKMMNYKLIILEFGLNATSSVKNDFSWYEREMVTVINKLKKAFPSAGIVLISIHDKSKKQGSSFKTDPIVLKLLEAQKNIVRKTKIAFWNLFESMGGKNSMPKWVASNPPLAFKDYTHFNDQGAKKVATMLTDALLAANKKYGK